MLKSGFSKKALLVLALPAMVCADFKYWDATDSSKTPRKLSALGLYVDITAPKKVMATNVYHFEVNSPLWSDDAHKNRWVVSRPGKPITWDTTDYWNYPDSQVFVKEFDIDTVIGDTTSRIKWETRILFNRKDVWDSNAVTGKVIYQDKWYGFSYKWNKAQTDADLVNQKIGSNDSIVVWPTGKVGASHKKKWHFPSIDECTKCHRSNMPDTNIHDRSVLGFFTAQLNRQAPDTSAAMNQLDYFFKHNVLTGTKPASWTTAPKWASVSDQSASIDLRARSFIASNCSGCHSGRGLRTGATTASLNYDYYNMIEAMDLRHHTVASDYTLNDSLPMYYPKNDSNNDRHLDFLPIDVAVIVPGYPTKSVLLRRIKTRRTEPGNYDPDLAQMPPLGTYEVYDSAVTVLTQWITAMPKSRQPQDSIGVGILGKVRTSLKSPSVTGRFLQIPAELAGTAKGKVSMLGISGRSVELKQISPTSYAIPDHLPVGLYLIRVGNQTFTRYLF